MSTQTQRRLIVANLVLAASLAAHGIDHALQERGLAALTTEVKIGGFVNATLGALSLLLAWRGSPRAPLAAVVAGTWIALAVVSAHFAPHWGVLSDPYSGLGLGFVSWLAAAFEAAAAAATAAVGFSALRRRRLAASAL